MTCKFVGILAIVLSSGILVRHVLQQDEVSKAEPEVEKVEADKPVAKSVPASFTEVQLKATRPILQRKIKLTFKQKADAILWKVANPKPDIVAKIAAPVNKLLDSGSKLAAALLPFSKKPMLEAPKAKYEIILEEDVPIGRRLYDPVNMWVDHNGVIQGIPRSVDDDEF